MQLQSRSSQSAFDPLDLEIIEQVYDAIWDSVRIADPFRNLRFKRLSAGSCLPRHL